MDEPNSIDVLDSEAEPDSELLASGPPEPEDWQETTLKRLEAWIEEREKLIEEIERRLEEEIAAA